MRIRLHFPTASIVAIVAMGLTQRNPETLRWTTDHPASSYGLGTILRGKTGVVLCGRDFAALNANFGAWVECDCADTKRRVENALCTAAINLDHEVRLE